MNSGSIELFAHTQLLFDWHLASSPARCLVVESPELLMQNLFASMVIIFDKGSAFHITVCLWWGRLDWILICCKYVNVIFCCRVLCLICFTVSTRPAYEVTKRPCSWKYMYVLWSYPSANYISCDWITLGVLFISVLSGYIEQLEVAFYLY